VNRGQKRLRTVIIPSGTMGSGAKRGIEVMRHETSISLMFKPYRDYGLISGRSRRKEYWLFVVLCVAAYCALWWFDEQTLLLGRDSRGDMPIFRVAILVYSLLPFVCVTVRRLHDTGRSGRWVLLYLVPVFGWLVLLCFMVLEGDPRPNFYGPSPKPSAPSRSGLARKDC
jgi:uncharacterized membrane protein YhaH (DUF805 family)